MQKIINQPLMATETSLARAVHQYIQQLREQEKESANIIELYKVLVRLGFQDQEVVQLPERGLASLSQALRIKAGSAIAIQLQAMARQIRQGGFHYDINLHIALKRAQAMLEGRPAKTDTSTRVSGHDLNSRFKRQGRIRQKQNVH